MNSKVKNAFIILVVGIVMFFIGILIGVIHSHRLGFFSAVGDFFIMFGFLVSIFGIVRMIVVSKYKKAVVQILASMIIIFIGILLTISHIKGEMAGVYTIGFIPLPTIILTAAMIVVGIYLLIIGVKKLK